MTSSTTQDPKPLIPPSRERCQAEITTTPSPFTMGGDLTPKTERCAQKPRHLLTETRPGPDGRRGSMTLCDECLKVFKASTPDWKDRVRIDGLLPVTERIRLPEAFAALLAETADLDLALSWRQPTVHYGVHGLGGDDRWLCECKAGPVWVDDTRPTDVRTATLDALHRLLKQAKFVQEDAEAGERKYKRRDLKMKEADRAAKARAVFLSLTKLLPLLRDAWPEPTIDAA